MKLRNKIHLSTAVLLAFLLIVMNISVYLTFSKLILDSELETAEKEMEKTTNDIGKSIGTIPVDTLLRSYIPINGMLQIITSDKKPLSSVTSPTEQNLIKQGSTFFSGDVSQFIVHQKKPYIFISMPIILLDGRVANLQVTKSLETATGNLKILRIVLVVMTVLALIPVIFSSRILSKVITMPITRMTTTMTEIRKSGRFQRLHVQETSKDELFLMGETFNHMIDLLKANYEKQQQFVANASHEFKTPLTVIESYASLLKRRGLTEPDLFAESIDAIHSEAIRMKEMTERLLMLAKHHEEWDIQKSRINLEGFLAQTIKTFRNAYRQEIDFQKKIASPLSIETDEKKLKQLLFIFLDNARKYSDDTISVVSGIVNDEVFIKIIDRGIGIHKNDLTKVFNRFYRVDQARNRKKGGSGLGLSIAKEIADALNIRIQLESDEGKGTTASLFIKI